MLIKMRDESREDLTVSSHKSRARERFHRCTHPCARYRLTKQIMSLRATTSAVALVMVILIASSSLCEANPIELDFPPKLIHQPPSVQVPANKPHTIECPVESRPESQVQWFKDNQLLEPQQSHSDQSGKELMFVSTTDDDTGSYHCEASNPLGSVKSDQFKLTVLSSIHDAAIRFEPRLAAVGADQPVEFRCIIPMTFEQRQQQSRLEHTAQPEVVDSDSDDVATPNVSWRRDGKRLPVRWTSSSSAATMDPSSGGGGGGARFVARQSAPNEFALTITRALANDDNSTYTCLYEPAVGAGDAIAAATGDASGGEPLARESSPVRLYVIKNYNSKQQQDGAGLGKQVSMAPAIENLPDQRAPNELNRTTSMAAVPVDSDLAVNSNANGNGHGNSSGGPRKVITLGETLRDLYELIRPTLAAAAIVALVGAVCVAQFLVLRRRLRQRHQHRYMKHHPYAHSGSSSGASSNASSVAAAAANSFVVGQRAPVATANGYAAADCDPVLSSLLNRTLSAPSAVSLSGAGKKYKSYRDHMRKVAAATPGELLHHNDFIDASNYLAHPDQDPFYSIAQQQQQQVQLPNLYNQSLAAREQARSLLQSSEHMRSLSNLSGHHLSGRQTGAGGGGQYTSDNSNNHNKRDSQHGLIAADRLYQQHQLPGSHMDIPLSLSAHVASNQQQQQNPLLPPHLLQSWATQRNNQRNHSHQQQQQRQNENYQLVNCASISPSSSSSSAASSSSASSNGSTVPVGSAQTDHLHSDLAGRSKRPHHQHKGAADVSVNHYSTIGTNEDDDDDNDNDDGDGEARYEELHEGGDHLQQQQQQSAASQRQAHASAVINRSVSNNSYSNQRTSTFVTLDNCSNLDNPKERSKNNSDRQRRSKQQDRPTRIKVDYQQQQQQHQEQLSPYAVSSIMPPPPSQPPPVATSEAMRALSEQFDVGQLMLIDEATSRRASKSKSKPNLKDETSSLLAQLPPPPPPPPTQPPEANKEDSLS